MGDLKKSHKITVPRRRIFICAFHISIKYTHSHQNNGFLTLNKIRYFSILGDNNMVLWVYEKSTNPEFGRSQSITKTIVPLFGINLSLLFLCRVLANTFSHIVGWPLSTEWITSNPFLMHGNHSCHHTIYCLLWCITSWGTWKSLGDYVDKLFQLNHLGDG